MKSFRIFLFLSAVLAVSQQPSVFGQLTVNYSLDSTQFFQRNPVARRALEAAVADLDAALQQNLGAVALTSTGTSGPVSVSSRGTPNVFNPSTVPAPSTPSQFREEVETDINRSIVPIFVGAQNLSGTQLGFGGTGGLFYQILPFGYDGGQGGNAITAFERSVEQANEVFSRGEGPVVGTISFTTTGNGSTSGISVELSFGLLNGFISFDSDVNQFHFDHTTAPATDQFDFYSVALHEAMHAVGVGPADQWDDLVSGSTWLGGQVRAFRGNGQGLIEGDGRHVLNSANNMSPRITDGVPQRSVMVPSFPRGTRMEITELDLAILRDLGFQNAVVPQRQYMTGDIDRDGNVDLADLDQFNGNVPAADTGGFLARGDRFFLDLDGSQTVQRIDFERHYTTFVETSNGRRGTVAGDANLDGRVDVLVDAFALVGNLSNPSIDSWSQGDFNADQTVDVLGDAFLLVANLGASND